MSTLIDTISSQSPDPDRPAVTIAIPVQNPNEEILTECLQSLTTQTLFPYCEILIIDSSTHHVQTFEDFREILNIYPLTRKNLSGARQDALDHARGEVIVGIDCDCIVDNDWLNAILKPLNKDTNVMATVGYNLPAVKGGVADWFQEAYENWILYVSAGIDRVRYMFTIDTKNYAVYTDVAREIGFDETMKAAEDHDFATRLRRKGYHIVYAPNAKVKHFHRETLHKLLQQQGWHGFGYGQTVVKNNLDIYCRRPFRHMIKQGLILILFPIFISKLLIEYKKGKWKGTLDYLVNWLITYRFQMGMISGMYSQGGWAYLKKRFLSDVFSYYSKPTNECR